MAKKIPNRFPGSEELKLMRKKLARAPGSMVLPDNANPLDRAKYSLCRIFVDYLLDHELSQKQLAHKLGVSEARVSEIVHYKINRLTMDRLLKYIGRINPKFALKAA